MSLYEPHDVINDRNRSMQHEQARPQILKWFPRYYVELTSVVTPKPANGGQGKTGQREEAGDSVVLSCRLLWWQVYFRTPTPGTTFEYMTMMEKTIEHGGNGGAISP
jgi:hypothetical protein